MCSHEMRGERVTPVVSSAGPAHGDPMDGTVPDRRSGRRTAIPNRKRYFARPECPHPSNLHNPTSKSAHLLTSWGRRATYPGMGLRRRRRGPLPRPAVCPPPWHPSAEPPRRRAGRPVRDGPGGAPADPGPALVRWRSVAGGSLSARPRSRFRSTSGGRPPPARPPGLGRTPAMASIGRADVPLTTLVPGSCPAFWKVDTNSTHPLFIPAPMV